MPTTLPPSIFNDVVGPVMRGPSSSHSAASVRIGRLARDLCGGDPESVLVEFDHEPETGINRIWVRDDQLLEPAGIGA